MAEVVEVNLLDLQLEQLRRLVKKRPELVKQALDAIYQHNADLRWEVVVGLYLDVKISLGKAAEMLGTNRWELIDRFREQGIPLPLGPKTIEELKRDIQVMEWVQGKADLPE